MGIFNFFKKKEKRTVYLNSNKSEIKEKNKEFDSNFSLISSTATSIHEEMFKNNTTITEIIIPKSVKQIGTSAFEGCINLKKVIMANDLIYIGDAAFKGCTSLKMIHISNKVKEINANTFYNCTALEEVECSSAEILKERAFYNCISLKTIFFSSLEVIEKEAFGNCSSFLTFHLGDFITSIAKDAFHGCHSLSIFSNYEVEGLKDDTLSTIKYDGTFDTYWKEKYPIDSEEYLDEIDILREFTNDNNGTITVHQGVKRICHSSFENLNDLKTVVLPDSTLYVASRIVNNCINFKKIEIPDSVLFLGSYFIDECGELDYIKYPAGIITINEKSLSEVTCNKVYIPEGIEKIESWAFYNVRFNEINFPRSLKYLDVEAFESSQIKELYINKEINDEMIEFVDKYYNGSFTNFCLDAVEKVYFKNEEVLKQYIDHDIHFKENRHKLFVK